MKLTHPNTALAVLAQQVHVFLVVNSWESAMLFATLWLSKCTEGDDDGFVVDVDVDDMAGSDGNGVGRRECHKGGALMAFFGQFLVIYLFIGLWMAAVWMSDPMGTQVANYDLQVDLQNLWAESLNSIAAMLDHSDVKVPEVYYSREDDHFEVIEEEEAATATTTTTANAKK